MTLTKHTRGLAFASLCLASATASAHTGDHGAAGFASGLAHPLQGLDHLFAMIAIGLWAAQQGGRALWAVPAAFVGTMALGGVLALSGIALPQVETVIALSVLVLGLLIASRRRYVLPAGIAIAASFALFHGYAHGQEMPLAASPLAYAAGFMLATVFLHGAGLVGSLLGRRAVQLAGTAIAAAGLALIVNA
jgi:urease accessory protein